MANKRSKVLADPTKLKPINKRDRTLQVIIETPKGKSEQVCLRPKTAHLRAQGSPTRGHGVSL